MPAGYAETSIVDGPLSNWAIFALVAASTSSSAARITPVPTRAGAAAPRRINASFWINFMGLFWVGRKPGAPRSDRSEEHTSELQSLRHLVCRLLLEKKKNK